MTQFIKNASYLYSAYTIEDKSRDRTSHDVVFEFGTGLTLSVDLTQKLKKMKTADPEYTIQ